MDYFTSARVPDPGLRNLFQIEHRWQRWLDVEAALAAAEAEHGIIPNAAAAAIARAASVQGLGPERIRAAIARTSTRSWAWSPS
jgi:3-carboxy-cis,cis-muconate cycloisomerase